MLTSAEKGVEGGLANADIFWQRGEGGSGKTDLKGFKQNSLLKLSYNIGYFGHRLFVLGSFCHSGRGGYDMYWQGWQGKRSFLFIMY